MLGGLVQAVHGLATLDDRSGVEILVTADEEVGSRSSRALIEERALACGAVLVFEGAADGGSLKTGRKGCGTFQVSITGRASHAGLEPEAGVNALVEAAHQVLDIAALGRPEHRHDGHPDRRVRGNPGQRRSRRGDRHRRRAGRVGRRRRSASRLRSPHWLRISTGRRSPFRGRRPAPDA